ncbi:hypothetical protein C8J57DRAFT_1492840 [Mycena rebaudengoi]|nr:hypothetical protein C8J57DRAFT_1492840 [Mycena rebaudengoi]
MELGGVILPPELEHTVFETAALLYHTQIPTLMLVAQRFHTWLQPILYRVLVSAGSKDISWWHRFPPIGDELLPERAALLQKHARHLSIQSPFIVEETRHSYPTSTTYALQLLRVYAVDLFAGPPDFSHSLFSSITHLELIDGGGISAYSDESWKSLVSLSCLTHLAFSYCPSVSARLLHMLLEELDMNFSNDTDNPLGDSIEDWVGGAWGQADVWVRADNFIHLKRRGKVPRDVHFIAEGDFADVELY